MATLIQSKQIQGVVTASVIDGEFVVSGSSLISGSQSILGDITSSGTVSASYFVGDGSQLTFGGTGLVSGSSQVTLSQVDGYNVFSSSVAASISGSSTTLPNGVISSSAQLTSLGFISESTDSQTLTYNQVSKQLTISDGNTVDLSSLGGGGGVGGSSIWSTGSNYYYVNSDLQVTGSVSVTSLTGSLDYSNLRNTPSGIVSGSSQLTSSFDSRYSLSGSSGVSSWNELTDIPSGIISSSEQLPSGIISSSDQVLGGTDILSGSHTDISSLNNYTSSTDDRISNLESFTSSLDSTYATDSELSSLSSSIATTIDNIQHTQIPSGTISGSSQLTSSFDERYALSGSVGSGTSDFTELTNVPSGLVSSSEQVLGGTDILSGSHTDITSINTFTSSIQSEVDSLTAATSSYLTSIDSGIVSSSAQVTELLPSGVISGSTFDNFSSSVDSRIDTEKSRIDAILTASDADKDSFAEIVDLINSVDTQNDEAFATHYTSSRQRLTSLESFTSSIQTEVDGLSAQTSSYLTSSGSVDFSDITSLPSGLVSSSEQVLGGTGILSGSHTDISSLNTFSSSIQTQIDSLVSATSSYLTSETDSQTLSISGDQLTISNGNTVTIPTGSNLPSGLISSSEQIGDLGYVTSSNEAPFNGNRIVSNTDLGDLYTNSFNAGTSGSLAQFVEAVFFPTSAPTATFTNQSANFNTNLATNNTNLVSVALTDTVDNSPYTLVLSGAGASSLTAVPTNSDSSSWEIRANGDLSSATYTYDVTVGDSTNAERTYSSRSITIAQANTGSFSTTGTLYIIESATSGPIYLSSTGRSGAQGGVSVSYSPNYGSQVATNFQSSNSLISINSSSGVLSVGDSISGSGNVSGDTITSTITYNDQYGNSGSEEITVNVTTNNAPTVASTQVSNNNTNQARNTNLILQLTITDTEGDSIPNSGLVFSGYNTTYFSETITTPYMQLRANSTNVPAGTYSYTASLSDEHGFSTNVVSSSFTINTPDDGTLGGDTSIYIIESAESSAVFRDATGFGNGNAAQVTVSYSPNYGSQAVQSFTSSNPAISIDSSGYLTLGVDLSGSVTQSGDTFTSTIGWTDQYGNSDSSTVTATVFGNQSPSVSFTDLGLNTDNAVSGSHIGTLTISDTETDTPFSASIGGTDGGKFEIVPQNANSSSYYVHPTGSLTQGDYSVQFVVVDNYSESVTLNETISVSSASTYGKVYIYTNTRTGGGTLSDGNYDGLLGITSEDTSTEPDLITGYQSVGPSPIYELKTGELGASSITVGGGTMTLRNTVSGSNLDTIISSSFNGNGSTAEQIMIIFPSGSDMDGIPTSMTDTLGGSTAGEYVLYLKAAGESSFTAAGTQIHMFDVDSAVEGFTRWNVIGRNSVNTASSYEVRLIPSSGSAP